MQQRLRIPDEFKRALGDSAWEAPILALADAVTRLVDDNKMPFFPDFTDHGRTHLEGVLASAIELVPRDVWQTGQIAPQDAAVFVGAVLLHDLGMHLREAGFVALVSEDTDFVPLPWFRDSRPGRVPDVAWADIWEAFQLEARHFSGVQRQNVLGSSSASIPDVAYASRGALDSDGWGPADLRLIGEFLRRHHARLAHEIAAYGFPGVGAAHLPVLRASLPALYDMIGATARSHGEDLRIGASYLDAVAPGVLTPSGAAVLYWMAVLRIADYVQIDARRAPPILYELRTVTNPISRAEWKKHGGVADVVWRHKDRSAVVVEVSEQHTPAIHFALQDLLADLQRELDTSNAVLAETFAAQGDDASWRLSRSRVVSNLDKPGFLDRLPFVARRAQLTTSDDLFGRIVRPLYGDRPEIGARELLQNAVDAVRERWRVERAHGPLAPAESREQDADVVLEVLPDTTTTSGWILRVSDRGVGMTADMVTDYFLRAGASLGPTELDWGGLVGAEAAAVLKAGHFGIGAFAAFQLGPRLDVLTRHFNDDEGLRFTVTEDSELIGLHRVAAPVGTEISVSLYPTEPPRLLSDVAEWYALSKPTVRFGPVGAPEPQRRCVPAPLEPLPPDWREVHVEGIDQVHWCVYPLEEIGGDQELAHNGIWLFGRDRGRSHAYDWCDPLLGVTFFRPPISVFDSRHRLPLALDRSRLQSKCLPFEDDLVRSIVDDVVAHGFVGGPSRYPLGKGEFLSPVQTSGGWFPFVPALAATLCPSLVVTWLRPKRLDISSFFQVAGGVFEWPGAAQNGSDGLQFVWGADMVETFMVADRDLGDAVFRQLPAMRREQWVEITRGKREKFNSKVSVFARRTEIPAAGNRRGRAGLTERTAEMADLMVPVMQAGVRRGDVALASLVSSWTAERSAEMARLVADHWMSVVGGAMPSDAAARKAILSGNPRLWQNVADWRELRQRKGR